MSSALHSKPAEPIEAAAASRAVKLRGASRSIQPKVPAERAPAPADLASTPRMIAQSKELQAAFGHAIQREAGPQEEELLQGKFEPMQRKGPEEDESLQGKFAPILREGSAAASVRSMGGRGAVQFLLGNDDVHTEVDATAPQKKESIDNYVARVLRGVPKNKRVAKDAAKDKKAIKEYALQKWSGDFGGGKEETKKGRDDELATTEAAKLLEATAMVNARWVHIYMGELREGGAPVGYHLEHEGALLEAVGEAIKVGDNGEYEKSVQAKQEPGSSKKKTPKEKKCISTFFPRDWSKQDIIAAVASRAKSGIYWEVTCAKGRGMRLNIRDDTIHPVIL